MKRAATFVLLLLAACGGEHGGATSTVAPANPRPDPVAPDLGTAPVVSTGGSPVPATAPAPGTEFVTIDRDGLSMRQLVPIGQTAFQIRNETASDHELVLRSESGARTAVTVKRGSHAVLQARLTERDYSLTCTVAGHREIARFRTYVPGGPLPVSSPAGRIR